MKTTDEIVGDIRERVRTLDEEIAPLADERLALLNALVELVPDDEFARAAVGAVRDMAGAAYVGGRKVADLTDVQAKVVVKRPARKRPAKARKRPPEPQGGQTLADAIRDAKDAAEKPKRRGRPPGSGKRGNEVVQILTVVGEALTIQEIAGHLGIKPNYLYRVMPALEGEGRVRKVQRVPLSDPTAKPKACWEAVAP